MTRPLDVLAQVADAMRHPNRTPEELQRLAEMLRGVRDARPDLRSSPSEANKAGPAVVAVVDGAVIGESVFDFFGAAAYTPPPEGAVESLRRAAPWLASELEAFRSVLTSVAPELRGAILGEMFEGVVEQLQRLGFWP